MSDTKILRAEDQAHWILERRSDILLCAKQKGSKPTDTHQKLFELEVKELTKWDAAQAKRIEELEQSLNLAWDTASSAQQKRDVAIKRAEAAEARVKLLGASLVEQRKCSEIWADKFDKAEEQLRQIQSALPAEGALKIASKLYHRTNSPEAVNALRAYAAALGKEG